MIRRLCVCVVLVLGGLSVQAEDSASVKPSLLRYSAGLSQAASNGASQPVRDFEIRCLVVPQTVGFPALLYLFDESTDDQPWREQFGRVEFDVEGQASPALPLQSHLHDGHRSWIDLRIGVFPTFSKLESGAEWTAGALRFSVVDEKSINAQPCWQLEINAPQGRRTTLLIQKSSGTIVTADHRYFVGMGERFDLNLKLEEFTAADSSTVETWTKATAPLLKLKQATQPVPGKDDASLTPEQSQLATESLDAVDQATDATPFAALAGVIRREVTAGQQRQSAVADLSTRFVGQPAPPISVTLLDGDKAISLSKPGKITVLHFWEYQEKPLAEPYGQIGYLDFLAQKRKGKVQVVGIISAQQVHEPRGAAAALRSARKLREFMNIGYTLGHETEGALAALGDPRAFGVDLPLWVVLGPDGKILHYRVGYYEVDASRGLEELDQILETELQGK